MNTQLEASLTADFLGANGSIGLGEHIEHGQINSPSRRLPASDDLDFSSEADEKPETSSMCVDTHKETSSSARKARIHTALIVTPSCEKIAKHNVIYMFHACSIAVTHAEARGNRAQSASYNRQHFATGSPGSRGV